MLGERRDICDDLEPELMLGVVVVGDFDEHEAPGPPCSSALSPELFQNNFSRYPSQLKKPNLASIALWKLGYNLSTWPFIALVEFGLDTDVSRQIGRAQVPRRSARGEKIPSYRRDQLGSKTRQRSRWQLFLAS